MKVDVWGVCVVFGGEGWGIESGDFVHCVSFLHISPSILSLPPSVITLLPLFLFAGGGREGGRVEWGEIGKGRGER